MNHYENDDRRNDDASFGDQVERFSRKLSDSAQQVWLAGLGALGRAQAEGSRFFDGLVKEGEAWEARRRERSGEQGPGWRDNVETSLDEAREKAREEARQKLEAEYAKKNEPPKPLPEFGSAEDFPLQQALNQLKGRPVAVSKTATERKAEAKVE